MEEAARQFEVYDWEIELGDSGERLDKFLSREGDWSRSLIQQWLGTGLAQVNGETAKSSTRLKEGDSVVLRVPPLQELTIQPEPTPLEVVYEDGDVIVINKPRGLVVHPAPGHSSGTLVNALLAHCQDLSGINGVLRPGIVHRIDKDTSGLLVVAKNDAAHLHLAAQLKEHRVNRVYIGIAWGGFKEKHGTVNAPIGRDPKERQRMAVVKKGKEAVTHYEVLHGYAQLALLRLRLETGRTHQIRVHMAYIGHPLLGDEKYTKKRHPAWPQVGQALHAQTLGFVHPRTGKYLQFEVEMPHDMSTFLQGMGHE